MYTDRQFYNYGLYIMHSFFSICKAHLITYDLPIPGIQFQMSAVSWSSPVLVLIL